MPSRSGLISNFTHLQSHDEQLLRLGMLAERYFADDPNTCLLKLRQLSELLAQLAASDIGVLDRPGEGQYELLLRRVEDLFAFADRIEARLSTAQKTVERLTPATLAKAFRGELVPQNLNDEPATSLLKRITDGKSRRTLRNERRSGNDH